MRSRLNKVETPEPMRPQGRFTNLETALAAFQATRDRSVKAARDRGETHSSVGARHPFFGAVNGVELINMIDGHARRHADQIRETWDQPAGSAKIAIVTTDPKLSFKKISSECPSSVTRRRSLRMGSSPSTPFPGILLVPAFQFPAWCSWSSGFSS